ncbi:MAG: helix-turn-helix domain-containing protein [Coriobacteriales bacterium]|jgi:mannose-6-phosphate isomerase-like protein (cupin superfamily)/DNA-binding XRE family transcriptional regulator
MANESTSTIGNKIKTLREAHGLTVEELAQRCDTDESIIRDLESGLAASSLAPLIKITRALGVRLGTLMDDDNQLGPVYTDVDGMAAGTFIHTFETTSGGDLNYFSLAAGRASRHIDPFIITIEPTGETSHELKGHEGEEFLYGLEGEIEIEYGTGPAARTYVLKPGESIYYDSIIPHQVRTHDGQSAKFLAVVYTPM